MPELYIGLMSGTSTDGVDAALVDFDGNQPRLIDFIFRPFSTELKKYIQDLSSVENKISLVDFGSLDCRLGHLFAETVNLLLVNSRLSASSIRAIGSHGQTVYHFPNSEFPFSLQIGDPNVIAEQTGITTVADFRRRDIACNGQGAPLVPAFHQAIFSHPRIHRCIVNIGGIANITVLPAQQSPQQNVKGFDTGPGNTLMDGWISEHKQLAFDRNGEWGKTGKVDIEWVELLKQDPYFQRQPPKSTGKEYFSRSWLEKYLKETKRLPEDIQASLCYLTAVTLADAIREHAPLTEEVFLCGGGTHNGLLVDMLATLLPFPVVSTAVHGINPDHVEAIAFAWLARQTLNGLPGNLTEVTGANQPRCLGGVYRA